MEQFTLVELTAVNSGQSILKANLYSGRLGGIFRDTFENGCFVFAAQHHFSGLVENQQHFTFNPDRLQIQAAASWIVLRLFTMGVKAASGMCKIAHIQNRFIWWVN